jgi:hypothetical protein
VLVEAMLPQSAPGSPNSRWPQLIRLDDGTTLNRMQLQNEANGNGIYMEWSTSGVNLANKFASGFSHTPGTPFRAMLRWNRTTRSISAGGLAPVSATAPAPAGVSQLRVGGDGSAGGAMHGRIRGIAAGTGYPSDAQMQAATVVGASLAALGPALNETYLGGTL